MFKSRQIATCLLATASIGLAVSPAMGDLTAEVSLLIADKVTGGETGFHAKKLNGPVLASEQADAIFYPASYIKVVQHLHAMLQVEELGNGIDLNTLLVVYDNAAESCAADHTGHTPTLRALDDVLQRMMGPSDNQDTNAVQEFFGLGAINATANGVVGMSAATQLNHKFGCGGPNNDPINQMPLLDATLLYERVALGEIFTDDANRQNYYQLMKNSNWLEDLMDEEAPANMSNTALDDFKSGVNMARKGGSVDKSSLMYRSVAGWIELPSHDCSTLPHREYVFGVFFGAVTAISPNFSTKTVVKAMLRDEVRAALEDWQACESCVSGNPGPCNVPHGNPGCDDADCCETVCDFDPLCCDPKFGWDAPCVSHAILLCDLGPDNDDCPDPKEIFNCQVINFDISNAVNDGPNHLLECNWDPTFTKDIWYQYTATSTGILTLSVCSDDVPNDPTTPFALWVGVYDDCLSCGVVQEPSLIDCTFGTVACGGGGVELQVPVTQGQCYKIRVAAGNPSLGTGQIELACIEPGDSGGDPNELGDLVGLVTFGTTNATTDGPPHAACLNAGDDQIHNDVWFSWTAPCTGTLTVDTCDTADFDTRVAVYDGCTAAPSDTNLLGCNDDAAGCPGFTSALSVPVSAGQCYLIRVGGYNGGSGTGILSIACAGLCLGDIDGDGFVGIIDFLLLLGAWGPCAGCPEDLDQDGMVGINDFLNLLGAWGPCP
jgi:hypothetical protein